ncbi:MAG TPA: phosphatase PAP2 family protein [Candidatus Tumulicola sp.]|nr:phosphatase PAP2 family protein [Candidatus Tumulicola sp.]
MRLWTISAVAFALFIVLGFLVATPPFSRLDAAATALQGHGMQAAVIFTESGRFLPLLSIGLIGIATLAAARLALWMGAGVLVSQIMSQGVVELIKIFFHRARPDHWLVYHEPGYSYPSGHASTAIVFFGSWLLIILMAPLPRLAKIVCAAVLFVWMLAIDWSRLALGAHYLTDVIGGTLFGIFWVSMVLAVLARLGVAASDLRAKRKAA